MMNKISNIFKLKEVKQPAEVKPGVNEDETRQTYREAGFSDSKGAKGNVINFRQELERIYQRFLKQCREDESLQEELRKPHQTALEKYQSEKNNLATLLKIKNKDEEDIDGEIKTLRSKIDRIKQNPKSEGVDADRKPKVQFYIGLILLVPITIYLLVFYISASYSAFFKEFGADANVTEVIFDGNALAHALKDGWLEFVFVLTIPFAFMGLGYLIHMFQKTTSKLRYAKIGGLVLVTFIFDAILAYQIEGKIFEISKLMGQEFSLSQAITSTGFWGIIFAGFVVYMIWGLVLDFVLKEHENADKVNEAIKAEHAKVEELKLKKGEIRLEVDKLNNTLSECEKKIIEALGSIDSIMIPVRQYLAYHSEYASGWLSYISGHLVMSEDIQSKMLNECKFVSDTFIKENNLNLDKEETFKLNVA